MNLHEVMGEVEFKRFLNRVKEKRPEIPIWDSNTDNSDDWKRKSGQQEGFDLCLVTLGLDITLIK